MNSCTYTYNTPDGFDHVLEVNFEHHNGLAGDFINPPEPEWCKVSDWVCQTHDDCPVNDASLDKELERIEDHCLNFFNKHRECKV